MQATVLENLLAGRVASPTFDLALPAREYQKLPASIVLQTGGLLLADDLGVGKTVEAIYLMAAPGTLPALVVTLTHLQRQWKAEVERFAPSLRVHVVRQGTPIR